MKRRCVVCLDLGGTNIRLGLVTVRGQILRRRRLKMKDFRDSRELYDELQEIIASFMTSTRDVGSPEAVAIGFAGPTSSSSGLVYFAPNIGSFSDLEVGPYLERSFGLPVFVENDANCAALGEFWCGSGHAAKSLFLFTIGTGLGGSFIVDGELWAGQHGIAGEVGHTVIMMDGPLCNCGRRGCLEALVSATAMVRKYNRIKKIRSGSRKDSITAKMVVNKARKGEKAARQVIGEVARALGIGIYNVFELLDPEVILIGGGVSRAGSILIGPAVKHAREMVCRPLRPKLKVRKAKLGDDAGLLGAAYLAFKRLTE